MAAPPPEPPVAPPLERLTSRDQVAGLALGDISDHFEPFLPQFMEGTLRAGGEVILWRGPSQVEGVLLYHAAERLVSVFTRSPSVALSLLEGRSGVDVFSELPLAPGFEVYHLYAADLSSWDPSHRFSHPVRTVRAEDGPTLLSMFREVYGRVDEGWFRPIPPPPEKGFAVEVDGRLAGAAWVSVAEGHARLHSLSVRPRYRLLGIGTDLWYARMLWARDQGARTALAEISEHARASQAIAAAGGMHRVGQMYRTHRP